MKRERIYKNLLDRWWFFRANLYSKRKSISLDDIMKCHNYDGNKMEQNLKDLIKSRHHFPVLPQKWFK